MRRRIERAPKRVPAAALRVGALAGLLALGACLAACNTTVRPAPVGNSNVIMPVGGSGAELRSMSVLAATRRGMSFEAVYSYTTPSGTEQVTFAQAPPKSLLKVGADGLVLDDGPTSYYCGEASCYAVTGASDPYAGIAQLFDGRTFRGSLRTDVTSVAALTAKGVALEYSTGTYAGQPSRCVRVFTAIGVPWTTWCVAGSGIIDHWSDGTSTFTLTSFTRTPPASDFEVPPGDSLVSPP